MKNHNDTGKDLILLEKTKAGGLTATCIDPSGKRTPLPGVGMYMYHNGERMPLTRDANGKTQEEPWAKIRPFHKRPSNEIQEKIDWYITGPGSRISWEEAIDDNAEIPPHRVSKGNLFKLLACGKFSMLTRCIFAEHQTNDIDNPEKKETVRQYLVENETMKLLQFERHFLQQQNYFRWLQLHYPEYTKEKGKQTFTRQNGLPNTEANFVPSIDKFLKLSFSKWKDYLNCCPHVRSETPTYETYKFLEEILQTKADKPNSEKLWIFLKKTLERPPSVDVKLRATQNAEANKKLKETLEKHASFKWKKRLLLLAFGDGGSITFRNKFGDERLGALLFDLEVFLSSQNKIRFINPKSKRINRTHNRHLQQNHSLQKENVKKIWEKAEPATIATGWIYISPLDPENTPQLSKEKAVEIAICLAVAGETDELLTYLQQKVFKYDIFPDLLNALKDYPESEKLILKWITEQV